MSDQACAGVDGMLDQLRKAATDGVLIVLAGSGASAEPPSPLPVWKGFADLMIAEVEKTEPTRAALMRQEAASGDYLEVANLFLRLPPAIRREFFSTHFGVVKALLPPTQKLLAGLPARHWLTTNFDPFLRYALAERNAEVEVLNNLEDDLKAVLNLWSRKHFAVHIHGKADVYDSLVYTPASYDTIRQRPSYRELLKRAFTSCTVLMYGYSCTDPDVLAVLRYVVEDLGGVTERTHYMVTSTAPAHAELLRQASVQVVTISSADGYGEGKRLLKQISEATPSSGTPELIPEARDRDLQRLVRVFLSLKDPHERANMYQIACASLVVQAAESRPIDPTELQSRVGHLAHVDYKAADRMVVEGLSLLNARKMIDLVDGKIAFRENAQESLPLVDPLVAAVEVRARSFDSSYQSSQPSRDAIRRIVTHVMMAQGMTVARSLLNEEDVAGYDLEGLIREACHQEPRPPIAVEQVIRRAVAGILRDPDAACSKVLFDLANAAYSLETLFLNPLEKPVWDMLKWKIFLDSNVVLRLVSPVTRFHSDFKALVDRCRRIGVPVSVLHPFIEECVTHVEQTATILAEVGSSISAVGEYVESMHERERSPILDWYFVALKTASKQLPFREFAKNNHITSKAEWTRLLWEKYGVVVEEPNITQKVDTSERETLWAELRQWRSDQSLAGRALRRNEASQVEWMLRLRDKGTRAWFLSIDDQLRRALVTLRKGHYAGFVMPPAALAQHLTDLHWGEVDFSGFSALMWTMPRRSPHDRASDLLLRKLAEHPDMVGVEPDWLRDQVEGIIRDGRAGTVIPTGLSDDESFAAQETSFLGTVRDLLPLAVEKILDALVRRRAASGNFGAR
jgi:hypothetical protein